MQNMECECLIFSLFGIKIYIIFNQIIITYSAEKIIQGKYSIFLVQYVGFKVSTWIKDVHFEYRINIKDSITNNKCYLSCLNNVSYNSKYQYSIIARTHVQS